MKLKKNIAISESGYIFNPETGESFTVNMTGVEILKKINEEKSTEEIKEYICKNYNIDPDSFEKDLKEFLEILKQYLLAEND